MITDLLNSVHDQPQNEQCTLNGYEEYKFTEKGAAYTVASVTQAGRVAKIKIYQGNGLRLTPDKIGQTLNFNLKSYQSRNNQIYISGFWNDKAQNTPQTPQTPPQQSNQVQGTMDGSHIRAKALDIAARMVAAKEYSYTAMFLEADDYVKYIISGTHPAGVAGARPTQDPDFPEE